MKKMAKIRKKWYEIVFITLMGIVCSPFFLIYFFLHFIYIIIVSPLEKKKYIKSAYFHKYNKKYVHGITKTSSFKLSNLLAEQGSRITVVNLNYGYSYLYNETTLFLYIYGESLSFNQESIKWFVTTRSGHQMALDNYIDFELSYVSPPVNCYNVMLLVNIDLITDTDYEKATSNKTFIIYHDETDLAKSLQNY